MCRYWHAHPHPQETESAKGCRATIWELIPVKISCYNNNIMVYIP